MYLKIEHLRTLEALRDAGSLQAAAEALNLTQSALSHQIKGLERHFGLRLFERKSRPVRFTRAGERLLRLADASLPAFRAAETELHRLASGESGRLHIAIECHSCFAWLMPTLERYQQQWPDVEVDIAMGHSFDAMAALRGGELDLVVSADPEDDALLDYHPLLDYEAVLVAHRDHPVVARAAERGHAVAADFRDLTLITYPVDRGRLDIFRQCLDPARVSPRALRTTELTIMMIQWVISQRGVCVLPDWALLEYRDRPMLRQLRIGPEGLRGRLYLATRRDDSEQPWMQGFIGMARTRTKKLVEDLK